MKLYRVLSLCLFIATMTGYPRNLLAADSDPLGWVSIPAIGLFRPIYEVPLVDHEWDLTALGNGVSHLGGTNWIDDDWGRVVLAGHTPGAFEQINTLGIGDEIVISDWDYMAIYRVIATYYESDLSNIDILAPSITPSLLLITCEGAGRRIVISELIKLKA